MANTLEGIKIKIDKALEAKNVVSISGLDKFTRTNYHDFFPREVYRVYKDAIISDRTTVTRQTLTEFSNPEFVKPILEYLEKVARNKLPKGEKFAIRDAITPGSYYDQQMAASNDPYYLCGKITVRIDGEKLILTRKDTSGEYEIESVEKFIDDVFKPNSKFEPYQVAIVNAINVYTKNTEAVLKGALTSIENSKKRLDQLEELSKGIPDGIKLLLELK